MVERFVVEEVKELIYDGDKLEEWKSKCEKMNLYGQLKLAKDGKSPIPFPMMNEPMRRVYCELCPVATDYKQYDTTAIPLEVLDLIILSENEKYFDRIEIWHDDKTPDPLVVGIVGNREWDAKRYLVARWGDVLRPFSELKEMAIARYKEKTEGMLKTKITQAQAYLSAIDENASQYMNGVGFQPLF